MDNPTKVLTIGIGALAAVAAFLGLQNTEETPEIIDSDIHGYDSKIEQEKRLEEKKEEARLEEEKRLEEKKKEEKRLEEEKKKEERLEEEKKEEKRLEEEKKEEKRLEEENVGEKMKIEVKEHLKEKSDNWGTFWKSEYDDITKETTN